MALPTSTIVMAVLTCIPFGLAIKETVSGTPKAAHDRDDWDSSDDDGDSNYDAEYARAEAAREAAEAERERVEALKEEEQVTARRTLFGAEVATLGSGFAGISLGMPEADIRPQVTTTLEERTGMEISLLPNGTLDWINVKPARGTDESDIYSLCLKLRTDLQAAWGAGTTEDYETRYWINRTTHTRASLNPESCTLSFDRYAAPKDWINKSKTSIVPVTLVGQPIAKLVEHNSTIEVDPSETSVRWLGLGVGAGSGEARFEAFYVKGKVVALVVTANVLEATREEIVAQLTSLYGKPVEDDEGNFRWKSRPLITVDNYEGAGIRVTVGTVPSEE